ncbi:hypothetical protein MTO96_004914 [Rhipicephalus appendiculatus]
MQPDGCAKVHWDAIVNGDNEEMIVEGVRPILNSMGPEDAPLLAKFTSGVIENMSSEEDIIFASVMHHVTIVFVYLPKIVDPDATTLSQMINVVTTALADTKGQLNKTLTFDKGLCYLVAYGLPGFSGESDAIDAVVFALKIADEVSAREGKVTVAITSGMTFCGGVGHPLRRDYTTIGRPVNLAARLMVAYSEHDVVCDEATHRLTLRSFENGVVTELPHRPLKGIKTPGKVFRINLDIDEDGMGELDMFEDTPVGRQQEIEKASHFLAGLTTARPAHNLLLIGGVRGSGKSHVLSFLVKVALKKGFRRQASRGATALENETLLQAKEHLILVLSWLCNTAPCLLAIDDSEFLDKWSFEMLEQAAQLSAKYPCAVLVSVHCESGRRSPDLLDTGSKAGLILELGPLSEQELFDLCIKRMQVQGVENDIVRGKWL